MNSLKHTITTSDRQGNDLIIKIRLNDECKNGHQDFAITADGYKKGRRSDAAHLYGGCCHDEILAVMPELQMFVDLHLCDYLGTPMYPVANGYFHLKSGSNDRPMAKDEFCTYYRITPAQYDVLSQAIDKVHYSMLLEGMPEIRATWKEQADKAIAELERMTGSQFTVDSVRTQWDGATDAQKEAFTKRMSDGYYTKAAAETREQLRIENKIADIRQEAKRKADEEIKEAEQKIAVILNAGEDVMGNIIIYRHDKTVTFNWMGYGKQFTPEEITAAWEKIAALPLFEGYSLKPNRK